MDKNKLEALLTIHPSSIGSSWCQSPQQAAISDAGKIENTEFFVGVITVNSTEQSRGLTRENCPDQSLISECVGRCDGEAMTGHIGPEGRGNPWSLRDLYRCKDEWRSWCECGALSGDMPHLSKLSEPRQRGRSLVSLS